MKISYPGLSSICLVIFGFLSLNLEAQEWSGIKDSLYSQSLNENREFQVILPDDYDTDENTERYEVLYVLDGQYYIEQVPFIYEWTVASGYMPKMILVVIPNVITDGVNLRIRDYTPESLLREPSPDEKWGGADAFLSFLENELTPVIEKNYRTNGKKTLLGSSLSGLFSVYAFFKSPGFFNSHIASDPSLYWGGEYVANLAAEVLPKMKENNSTLFIAGLERSYVNMGIEKLDSLLRAASIGAPKWKCQIYADETHFSVQHKAFYDGLRFSSFGYKKKLPNYHPMNGIVESRKPFEIHVFNDDASLLTTYSTDGSVPLYNSQEMNAGHDITIDEPVSLHIKGFPYRSEYTLESHGNFTLKSSKLKAVKSRNKGESVLKYTLYDGDWESFPDIEKLEPTLINDIDSLFTLRGLNRGGGSSVHAIHGNFEVSQDGYYVFMAYANDGVKLYIDGLELFASDVEDQDDQSFIIPLQAGFHELRLEFFSVSPNSYMNIKTYFGDYKSKWWKSQVQILPWRN